MEFTRYAIYYTPAPGAFAQAGADWLGWNLATGAASAPPFPEETKSPRAYGFHATLKAPFALAPGTSPENLQTALTDFATSTSPLTLPPLHLTQLTTFLALTPSAPSLALQALAGRIVTHFDPFRAPLTAAALTRRRAANLTPKQDALLLKWGYPHVLDQFRFHMTLTGPLPAPAPLQNAAKTHFTPHLPTPFTLDALTLAGQDTTGRFHALTRFPLTGSPPTGT